MDLPRLYKMTSTGKIEESLIRVITGGEFPIIETSFGVVGGKTQSVRTLIKEGKNLGKKNETSPLEQAHKEALSKWEKAKKKGYVESIEAASKKEVDSLLIEGGLLPMLAHDYSKHGQKIIFPCHAQPKLDGIRCLALKKGEEVSLWSRTRKRIKCLPHIEKAIRDLFSSHDEIALDGELYNHEMRDDFEKIVSLVRQEAPSLEGESPIQYHIYDAAISGAPFIGRNSFLSERDFVAPLCLVETRILETREEVALLREEYERASYEGLMLRNSSSPYEHKRSYNLQKVKEFSDEEFPIVGVVEGKGKLSGLLGVFILMTREGETFEAKMGGDQEKTRAFLHDESLWKGKLLTVQYQGFTGKKKVPRFPVGLRLRDPQF